MSEYNLYHTDNMILYTDLPSLKIQYTNSEFPDAYWRSDATQQLYDFAKSLKILPVACGSEQAGGCIPMNWSASRAPRSPYIV